MLSAFEDTYKLVLGLEIHIHLKTQTKMFCGCPADIYSSKPNTHTCPTCLGLPGALPVPNQDAVKKTQLLGLALKCALNKNSRFDRKHYFYPDLPKGYQISQYKQPLCENGALTLENGNIVKIERIHLEEDTAKSFHENGKTLIDFNKSGMPLVEIVTSPCFSLVQDAVEFSKKIQQIAKYLEITDADMEKGQMRLEANISLGTKEIEKANKLPNYKVEIKNINSFKFMEQAVEAEIVRQANLLSSGKKIKQENRGWDEILGVTISQRIKEEAHDYRYFPEPDIPPMSFDSEYFENLRKTHLVLPQNVKERYLNQFGLSITIAEFLTQYDNKLLREKLEMLIETGIDPIKSANILINKSEYKDLDVNEIIEKITEETNSISNEDELINYVTRVLQNNLDVVDSYKKGKKNSLQFLIGQVMRLTEGKANPKVVKKLLTSVITK